MESVDRNGIFGTRNRTNVLMSLFLLEESHPSEIARIYKIDVSTIQDAVDGLERAGLVAGRIEGKTRRIRLNPRFYAFKELNAFLNVLALNNKDLIDKVADLRRRPRRSGKER